MTPFDTALKFLLEQEGGYVNDPHDRGGMTNLGVTAATWARWSHKPATEPIMRALTPADVAPLYRVQYWMPVAGDSLPAGVGLSVFDFAVNAGVPIAARALQRIVGEKQDGWIGAGSLASVSKWCAKYSSRDLITAYANARTAFYRSANGFDRYGRGWLTRCSAVERAALAIA